MSSLLSRRSGRRPLLSINASSVSAAICIGVCLFYYWKWIVVTSNTIFYASTDHIGDSPDYWIRYAGIEQDIVFHTSKKTNSTANLSSTFAEETTSVNTHDLIKNSPSNQSLRFYILPSPDIIEILKPVFNETKSELWKRASEYYQNALNEESAELWLDRGFQQLHQAQTTAKNRRDADVYVVVGYLHLFNGLLSSEQQWAETLVPKFYRSIVVDPSKPHLILTPTWNPERSRRIGLHSLVKTLQLQGVSDSNIWSVGFERNVKWQPVPLASQIIPIPYVTRLPERSGTVPPMGYKLIDNIFFAGDPRKHAQEWAGCSRPKLVDALHEKLNVSGVHKKILLLDNNQRMDQSTYNEHMRAYEYCLVLCGDTPSSRALTTAIVEGCIPVRVGSRLRGLCDPPCHAGFGWEVTGSENPHMPFAEKIPWDFFPEINEAVLLNETALLSWNASNRSDITRDHHFALQNLFQQNQEVLDKRELYDIIDRVWTGFVYGYGDPVTSHDFGDAAAYIWESFVAALQKSQ